MKYIWECRRTFAGVVAIGCLTYLGHNGADVAGSISFVVAAIAGANASQKIFETKANVTVDNK